MKNAPEKDTQSVSNIDAFTYATSKLDSAAVLSAVYRHDAIPAHNLGFIGTVYTAAHEGMELLLKVYLRRTMNLDQNATRGHDLGELFMMWDEKGRTAAELAYQHGVAQDLEANRIWPATLKVAMNVSPPSKILPTDYSERKIEYEKASRRYKAELLCEASPTVGDVVSRLDAVLGPRNITWLCPGYADEIQGHSWGPEVWYPRELLAMEWSWFTDAIRKDEPLGLVETFLKHEGTKDVFEGWRYQEEMKLHKGGVVFHGPPARMILIAKHLKHVVFKSLPDD